MGICDKRITQKMKENKRKTMKNQPTRQNNRQLLKIMNMRKCKLEKKNMELHDIGIETI